LHPEKGQFGMDQGVRKILSQAYGGYSEDNVLKTTQMSGKLAIYGWARVFN
jgi:hypothetical protein